jgi:hypothetical protein
VALAVKPTWSTFNPLRLTGHALPPPLVLIARLLAMLLLLRGESPFRPYLPYVELLDRFPPDTLGLFMRVATDVGYLLTLFTPFVRLGTGIAGSLHLVGLLGCRPCLSVAHTFVACLLLMIALSDRQTEGRLVRMQIALLYAGASLNKMVDPDWWNGRYFDALLIAHHQHALYTAVAEALPRGLLSTAMGVATIAVQAALAVCFVSPRAYTAGVLIGVVFHGAMLLLMQSTFGPFFGSLLIGYLAFLPLDRTLTPPNDVSGSAVASR